MNYSRQVRMGILVWVLFLGNQLQAQSYFNPLFLDQLNLGHSRDIALSGANTSAYSSAMNTFVNPANQAGFQGLGLSGSFALMSSIENRSFPAIDQFGDVVTNNIYVVSNRLQNTFSGGATWGVERLAVSIASMPLLTPSFSFKEEIRGSLYAPNINRDPLIGYHHVNQTGVIQASGVSFASGFGGWSAGFGLRMLHGIGLENEYGISVLDSTDVSALASAETLLKQETWALENSPLLLNLGLIKDLGLHWRMSASYQSGYSLESNRQGAMPIYNSTLDLPLIQWTSDTLNLSIDIPARLEVGLRMRPSNLLPTSVFVSLAYQDWSNYQISYGDSLSTQPAPFEFPMQEAFYISGGIEHWANVNVPFRAGFTWAESPIAGELSQSRFSAGSGWKNGPLEFDVAVQLSSVQYRFIDIFVPTQMSPNAYENVRESQTNYSFSVSYRL